MWVATYSSDTAFSVKLGQRTTLGSHERIGVFRIFGRNAGYSAWYAAYVTSSRCVINWSSTWTWAGHSAKRSQRLAVAS